MGIAYALGREWAKLAPAGKLVLGGLLAALASVPFMPACSPGGPPPTQSTAPGRPTSAASAAEARIAKQRLECDQALPSQQAQYDKHMAARDYWKAAGAIRVCADVLRSPSLEALVKDAEVKSHLAEINNPKVQARDRARAMQMLARDYPDVGGKYAAQAEKLIARADREDAAAAARLKRSQGVHIGMSRADVLASSWGRPERINTTTTARGTHEQWVYGGGRNYLYFQDGTLTTIQN